MRVIVAVRACMRDCVAWLCLEEGDIRRFLGLLAKEYPCIPCLRRCVPQSGLVWMCGPAATSLSPKELSGCWLWKTGAPWLEYDILLEL